MVATPHKPAMEPVKTWPQALDELMRGALSRPVEATRIAPHVRAMTSVDDVLLLFVIASLPALAVGLWNLGAQTFGALAVAGLDSLPGWRGRVFEVLGLPVSGESALACVVFGLLQFLPMLIVAVAVAVFWEVLFAALRRRAIDPGWLMSSWLFALLLPSAVPLWIVVPGMSFGVVIGKHVFGGTGKYIASPPLLGVLFLYFGYPDLFAGDSALAPVPGFAGISTWAAIADGGLSASVSWWQVFLGQEAGAIGSVSALACLVGAAYLVYRGAASHRTVVGALAGSLLAALAFNQLGGDDPARLLPWHWHLAVGGFAFGIAFLATDPTTSATTPGGRWIQGLLIGILTVVMRVANPSHPDGVLFAILVVALATPLIDYCVLRVLLARSGTRMSP